MRNEVGDSCLGHGDPCAACNRHQFRIVQIGLVAGNLQQLVELGAEAVVDDLAALPQLMGAGVDHRPVIQVLERAASDRGDGQQGTFYEGTALADKSIRVLQVLAGGDWRVLLEPVGRMALV